MATIKGLSEQLAELCNKQAELVTDMRAWSEKREEYDRREDDIKAVTSTLTSLKSVSDLGPLLDASTRSEKQPEVAKSLGQQFTDSEAYKAAVAMKGSRFSTPSVLLKAPVTTPNVAGAGFAQQLAGIRGVLSDRLRAADLFAPGVTSRGSIEYIRENAFTNNAAVVLEGGAKPLSTIEIEKVSAALKKVAHHANVSDEGLSDIDEMQSHINERLVYGVAVKEEEEVIADLIATPGVGTETEQLPGTAPDDEFSAVYFAMTDVRVNTGYEPDGIIMNPLDWRDLRLAKDANEQFYGGGPFVGQYGTGGMAAETLWNLPVVTSKAIAAGTMVVGSFRLGGQLWRKGGISVDMTNSHANDFTNNLITIRAEERLLLAVYVPAAFEVVTLIAD